MEHRILHAQCGEVRIIGIPGILVCGVGSNEPVILLANLDAVLKEQNVLEAKAVIALVYRRSATKIEAINRF